MELLCSGKAFVTKLVTIFGGTGFVGRYIAQKMAKEGWRVRVAGRRPNEANFVRTYGVVGQVEPILSDVFDSESVTHAIRGADAVVNCIGILAESKSGSFHGVQVDVPAKIAKAASEQGVERMVAPTYF